MRNKLLVSERHADVFEQLLNAWVGHLVVLGRDEDARRGDQGHDLVLRLASEVRDAQDMLSDVRHLEVSVIG